MKLAQSNRVKLKVGDVIEIANFTDRLDETMGKGCGEETPVMNGRVVEVTAVGEEAVLGFTLTGSGQLHDGKGYGAFVWERHGEETSHRSAVMFRRIGRADGNGYAWDFPDLDNIYHRCQR